MKSNAPRVGVVVLNWHGRETTRTCIEALRALDYQDCFTVLIDNGCEDFSAAEVATLLPSARYLRSDRNLGFTGGSNLGMREALQAGAQYVWFLNNDAEPEADALTELVATAERDATIGIVGPKILQAKRPERFDSVAVRVDLRTGRLYLLGHDEPDRGQYDQLADTVAITGCAMLVRREICERLGGFDESYFAYLEDVDLCLRARAAGFRVVVAPRSRVRHSRAVATGGRQSASSLYYATRNHLFLMQRHRGPSLPRTATILALNLAYAIRTGTRGSATRLRAVWRGWRDFRGGIVGPGHPPVEARRRGVCPGAAAAR